MIDFHTYDEQNPNIWELFKKYAFKTKAKGFKHYSAKAIFEIARWHEGGKIGADGFKLNNNYTADYARKLVKENPIFEGFFRTRELKAERTTTREEISDENGNYSYEKHLNSQSK